MKKLLVVALVSISSISFAWERMGSDVVFETRPIASQKRLAGGPAYIPVVDIVHTEPMVEEPVAVERTYYRDYRPVSGVIRGAETAAEGAVEGTAQAVESIIP
jgi:hypothetical protein